MNERKTITEIFSPEELPKEIRLELERSGNGTCRSGGKIYALTGGKVFCCGDDPAGNELLCHLAANPGRTDERPRNRKDLYRKILTEAQNIQDPEVMEEYRLKPSCRGCVVVYRACEGREAGPLYELMSQMIPLEKQDMLISTGTGSAAFIRESEAFLPDELYEYTEAVIGSLESEGVAGIRAGIGSIYTDPAELLTSFRNAGKALDIGMKYHDRDSVFRYSGQAFERILESIPKEKLEEIRKDYRNAESPWHLSDETLETVRVFFRNDLNLTAASRQLFIHRNTMNYRLDKIKRDTGLDLRSFEDAVIFKILSGIPENNPSEQGTKKGKN